MRSPSRTVPVLAVACVLFLSACSVWGEDDAPESPEPSAISPDSVIICEEIGDCGQAGAVRWSRPLEGDFYLERFEDRAPMLQPARHWLDYGYPAPGAVEADGILYLHTADTVVAVDTASAATLWTESVGFDVARLRLVGTTLVAVPDAGQGEMDALRLLEVGRTRRPAPVQHTRLRLRGGELPGGQDHRGRPRRR